jgi:hypothetical protein
MDNESEKSDRKFVVLYHRFSPGHERTDHFDLMLEGPDSLMTWAVNVIESELLDVAANDEWAERKSAKCVRLSNHRKFYLDYEGPVSNDRGSVKQVLSGQYRRMDDQSFLLESEDSTFQIEFINSVNSVELELVATVAFWQAIRAGLGQDSNS